MKKALITSYLDGLRDRSKGASYTKIMRYFAPEMVSALVLYSLVVLIDARFIAHLKSTVLYATIGVTNTLIHFLTKIAEGISVGTMVLCGYHHGKGDSDAVQRAAVSSFIVTAVLGCIVGAVLYWCAGDIYRLLGIPEDIVIIGIPFLRMKAISIVLMFLFFSLSGFLRGIQQNYIPTRCLVFGSLVFVLCDYLLIFGKCGFPRLCLQGSAIASVVQYSCMLGTLAVAMARTDYIRQFMTSWYRSWSLRSAYRIGVLSWPVMCDKSVLAFAKMAIVRAIAPMGHVALSSFGVIKDIEMFAFVPAVAFAQVTTMLVSNHFGAGDIEAIRYTVKRTLILAVSMVMFILGICSWYAPVIVGWFDAHHVFTDFAVPALRIMSCVAVFDVLQVILSSALRGVAHMRVVLWVRIGMLVGVLIPATWLMSSIAFMNDFDTFIGVYSSFYFGNGLMALCYVYWFRSGRWRHTMW